MANYVKLVVLVVTLMVSISTVRGQDPVVVPVYVCKGANDANCDDCQTPVFCKSEAEDDGKFLVITPTNACPSGQVCEVQFGTPTCVAISSTTKCQCSKPSQCDAHNPNAVLNCAGSNPIHVQQCGENEKCNINKCEGDTPPVGETCTGATDGWNLITPDCKSAAYCVNKESQGVSECGSGEYFDLGTSDCAAAPPARCGDSCSGACPDLTDCASYDVCDGNGNSVHSMACPDGQLFDPSKRRCVPEADPSAIDPAPGCVALAKCIFPPASTTTTGGVTTPTTTTPTTPTTPTTIPTITPTSTPTTIPTTTPTTIPTIPTIPTTPTPTTTPTTTPVRPQTCDRSTLGNYPYAGDCKKYWSCRLVASNTYGFVEGTCPATLVFNPATTFCDYPANVQCL